MAHDGQNFCHDRLKKLIPQYASSMKEIQVQANRKSTSLGKASFATSSSSRADPATKRPTSHILLLHLPLHPKTDQLCSDMTKTHPTMNLFRESGAQPPLWRYTAASQIWIPTSKSFAHFITHQCYIRVHYLTLSQMSTPYSHTDPSLRIPSST